VAQPTTSDSGGGRPLRIAIDARAAAEVPAGRGRYVRELLRALAALDAGHLYVLYARERWEDPALAGDRRFHWRIVAAGEPQWSALAAVHASRECDVVLAANSYLMAAAARVPALTTVYDLTTFRRDIALPRGAALERLTLPLAVRRASALLAISAATRDDLVARFPSAAPKTHVTELAADPVFGDGDPAADAEVVRRHGLDKPYVLALGTLEPRKNLPRLIEAFAGLDPQLRAAHELVLVGGSGWADGEIDASIARHRDVVRALGYVEDGDLPALYRRAALFAYPSLFEGFGLPVLEAMTAGTAVLTSDVSSLPEVGGDAVAYADPLSVEAIGAQLDALLRAPGERERLAAAGRERSHRFSWKRTAEETLRAVEAAAASGRR
jgi:glycosyltransferase involved in cell wall biosynthesis